MNMIMDFSNPKTAFEWAELLSKTRTIPKEYWDRPHEILATIQYGSELGLKPMQSLQGMANINGKPSLYGDLLLAVCMQSPDYIDMAESFDEASWTATCVVKRKNRADITRTFSKNDATVAGLWNKAGPWKQYPERMLQMRARGFALRDGWADVLRGVISREEAQDYQIKDVTPDKELDKAVEHKMVLELEHGLRVDYLNDLIAQKEVREEVVVSWAQKAGVSDISLATPEIVNKIINHLETK